MIEKKITDCQMWFSAVRGCFNEGSAFRNKYQSVLVKQHGISDVRKTQNFEKMEPVLLHNSIDCTTTNTA